MLNAVGDFDRPSSSRTLVTSPLYAPPSLPRSHGGMFRHCFCGWTGRFNRVSICDDLQGARL